MFSLYDSVTGLTKTDNELGFHVTNMESWVPGMPDVMESERMVAGRHGSYDFGGHLMPKIWHFRCFLRDAKTQSEIKAALGELNAFLVDGWGYPKTLRMEFDSEPGKYYNVRYGGGTQFLSIEPAWDRLFDLPLIAHDPLKYGDQVTEEFTITESPQSSQINVVSGLNCPLTLVLENEGTDVEDPSFLTFVLLHEWSKY